MDATEPNPLGNHDQLEFHIFLRSREMGINSIAFRFYRKKNPKINYSSLLNTACL